MPGRREENAGKRMLKHLSAILEKSGCGLSNNLQ